jgi:N-acetylmuramoyl-L-alanine amidase CwlA
VATTVDLAQSLGLTIQVKLLPPNGTNIPGVLMPGGKFKTLTIHETANFNPGTDALMHWKFVKNGGGAKKASFTYCVDSNGAIQILKENEQNNAAGTDEGNRSSLSIETCVNSDGDFSKTLENLAKLTAAILVANEKPLGSVVQHNVWYGKDCPFRIRHADAGWQALLHEIGKCMEELKPASTPSDFFPETGHSTGGAIRDHFRAEGGVVRFGFPLEQETMRTLEDGNQYTTQMFERALLHWRPGEAVGEARVGWMYLNSFPL